MRNIGFALLLGTALAACSGAGGGAGVPGSAVDSWPAKWCQAKPGFTKDALIGLMGAPSGQSATFANWQEGNYQFNAFLEPDGTVRQLDTNTYSLSEAQKAALTCDTTRTLETEREREEAAAAAAKPRRTTFPLACTLVTASEMSAILGFEVEAEPDESSNGKTTCRYKKPTGLSSDVELSVSWGDGGVAMNAMGMANRQEPGLTSPYDGVGDEATAVGPVLFIRSGEDLIEMMVSGASDPPAAAKRIFDTAKAKM